MLRIGLLGAGRIGRLHADILRHRVGGAEVAVVYDSDADRGSGLAHEQGIDLADNIDQVFAADIDAVAICTPTDSHAELIERAAAAGHHVFCEKPISLDLDDLDRAIAAVEHAGVKLQVGFNRRYDPSHRAVRDAVIGGNIGSPHLVKITSRDPEPPSPEYLATSGGLFLDMTIHDFDMARFLIDEEIVEVFAVAGALVDPEIGHLDDVDTAVITLRFESGAIGVIDNCRRADYGYDQRVEVLGTRGMARSDNHRLNHSTVETATGALRPPAQPFFLERYLDSYIEQWHAFVAAIRDDQPTDVDGSAARAPLVLGLAAQRSLATGEPVRCQPAGSASPLHARPERSEQQLAR